MALDSWSRDPEAMAAAILKQWPWIHLPEAEIA
jgi:hypothetical protein